MKKIINSMIEKNTLPFEKREPKVIVKIDAKTDSKFGKDPNTRTAEELLNSGIINIDKPKGPTSHQVSAYVKKIIKLSKAGHSGTLDPKVTGVLAVAIGKGTRIVQALLPAGKEYVAIMHLHKPTEEEEIRRVCEDFIGKIKQLPPQKSSVKRQLRFRKIYYIDILEIDENKQDVLLITGVQGGTYIRKLIHDIGQKVGCGAHMAELRRTKAGPFNENTGLTTLQELADAYHYYKEEGNDKYIKQIIQPIENSVTHLSKIWVRDSAIDTICHGADLKMPGIAKFDNDFQVDDVIAVMSLKDELVALGEVKMTPKDVIANEKGLVVKVNKVFMETGTYPNINKGGYD